MVNKYFSIITLLTQHFSLPHDLRQPGILQPVPDQQILGIIMCVGVSIVSYIIIFHTLRKLQSQVQNYVPGEETAQNSLKIKRYTKSVSTALWVYASHLACYLSFMLSLVFQITMGISPTLLGVKWLTVSLIYMNSALNPILYCCMIPGVRESVKEINKEICCCCKWCLQRNMSVYIPLKSSDPVLLK